MGNVNKKPQQILEPAIEHEDQESPLLAFTCELCIEPVTLPNKKFKNSNRCVHPFCTDCMIKYIQVKLEDNVSYIKCPALKCYHYLEPLSSRSKIPHQLFNKWCDVLCDLMVLRLDRVYCPNTDCSALIINECGGGGNLKRCVCPNCKKPFCFKCKIAWHAGYTCEESGETMDQNDVAFGVLSEKNRWMRCPQCRHCVELAKGCPYIRCRCGIEFCYRCGKNVCRHSCNCEQILDIVSIISIFILLLLFCLPIFIL